MNQRILEDLYNTTEENFLYGVGLLALPDQESAPIIHIHYRNWSWEKLEIVRESFRAGLVLNFSRRAEKTFDLHVSTRELIGIQTKQDGHTSVLHAPAWNAHLEGIDERVVQQFQVDRRRLGGFSLLIQTPEWEFLSMVNDNGDSTQISRMMPRAFPIPTG